MILYCKADKLRPWKTLQFLPTLIQTLWCPQQQCSIIFLNERHGWLLVFNLWSIRPTHTKKISHFVDIFLTRFYNPTPEISSGQQPNMVVVPQGVVSGYRSGGRQAKSSLSSGHEVKVEQRKKGGWGARRSHRITTLSLFTSVKARWERQFMADREVRNCLGNKVSYLMQNTFHAPAFIRPKETLYLRLLRGAFFTFAISCCHVSQSLLICKNFKK